MGQTQTTTPVVSGVPYLVTEVAGREPTVMEDFIGSAVAFTARRDAASCVVVGDGIAHGHSVRFNQKAGGAGRDVRVWEICFNASDRTFRAQTIRSI